MEEKLESRGAEESLELAALGEILPDLALAQETQALTGVSAGGSLKGLFKKTAPDRATQYRQGLAQARAARGWLEAPANRCRPFPELLAKARSEFSGSEAAGTGRLVESELKRAWGQLNQDPLGYVEKAGQRQMTALSRQGLLNSDDPAAQTQTRIALGRSLAKKLGFEDQGMVLSRAEAEARGRELEGIKEPEARLAKLAEYEQHFGRYAARAFKQLDISPEERLALKFYKDPDPGVRRAGLTGFKYLGAAAGPGGVEKQRLLDDLKTMFESQSAARRLEDKFFASAADEEAWADLAAFYQLTEAAALGAAGNGQDGLRTAARLLKALGGD